MQCPSPLSAPALMGHFYTLNAIWQPPHTTRRYDVVLAATPNQASSGQRRACSTSTIENESIRLMRYPSPLSAPTLMGHFHTLNAIWQSPHTTRRYDVVLAATPNQASSGQRRPCSTSNIENESIRLMLYPSVLSAPTLMGHFHTLNAIWQSPHTTRK